MRTYAAIPPLVTFPKSVAVHSAAELVYCDCDETTGIVHFTAPSSHKRGTLNTVSLDTYSGQIFCDCTGAMTDHLCWHCCYVTAAWQADPAVAETRVLIGSRLLTFGKKHARLVETYRQRIGRAGEYDAVRLLAARWKYRQRTAIVAMPLAA